MEFIPGKDVYTLSNPGIDSRQCLAPHNSSSTQLTITRVTVAPGVTQPRHCHDSSEQIWLALSGSGQLLLADGASKTFEAGDVARFEQGDIHGLYNDTAETFEYISVTTPPIDFGYAYRDGKP